MTRHECEEKLLSLAQQIRETYLRYNPNGEHIGVTIGRNGLIMIGDGFFDERGRLKLDENGDMIQSVNCTMFADGTVEHEAEEFAV